MKENINLITNRVKFDNMQEQKSLGIAASKENKEFFSIISHNIKNPFATLLGFSDLLLEDYDELNDEERKFYLDEILKSANFTNKYLERFFEWIYYKTGKAKIVLEEINLADLINNSILLINKKVAANNIIFNQNSTLLIKGDSDSLTKVLFYVLENAVIYSENHGNILINYTFDELYATVIIKDEGIGISEEQMQKLFKINEDITLAVRTKSKTKGTGLGLILAKQLLDLNKGNIYIDSEIGKGTEVKIKMPLFQKFN